MGSSFVREKKASVRLSPNPVARKPLKLVLSTGATVVALALLVPVVTGVSIKQLFQSINLNAYRSFDLTYIRASHALEQGNLDVATENVLMLPEDSAESHEIVIALYPRLLEARDYHRAARILHYIKKSPQLPGPGFLATASWNGVVSPGSLGEHLGRNMSLQKALAWIAEDPELAALRPYLLRTLFLAGAATEELPVLEKLTTTLNASEQVIALEAIVYTYTRAKNWKAAWQWAEKLSRERRQSGRDYVLTECASLAPTEALAFVRTKKNAPEFTFLYTAALMGIARKQRQKLPSLLELAHSPKMHDKAIGMALTQHPATSLDELTTLLDKQTDLAIKAWTLVHMNPPEELRTNAARQEFHLHTTIPRLTALAHQNPKLVPLHDGFIHRQMGSSLSKELKKRYLAAVLDPAKKKDWAAFATPEGRSNPADRFNAVFSTSFSLTRPVDADRLTGLSD